MESEMKENIEWEGEMCGSNSSLSMEYAIL